MQLTHLIDTRAEHGWQQPYFMPYVCHLAKAHECLLISTEVQKCRGGDNLQQGIYSDYMIGTPIEQEHILIK